MKTLLQTTTNPVLSGWARLVLLGLLLWCTAAGTPQAGEPQRLPSRREYEKIRARAQKGDRFAQQVMGVGYLVGSPEVRRDHVEAQFWFRKAAAQGDAVSQRFLGMIHSEGWGGSLDHAEALKWYRQAAEKGDAISQAALGRLYAEGRGVPPDPVRAHMWLSLAMPSLPADDWLETNEKVASLAKELTPQQREKAREMAKECRSAGYREPEPVPVALPGPARPPEADDRIQVHGMTVHLPAAPGWRKSEKPMPGESVLHEIERDLPGGNRVQIHVVDYCGRPRILDRELELSGLGDAERLEVFLEGMTQPPASVFAEFRDTQWVDAKRGPQLRFHAAGRENHGVREERTPDGRLHLWHDWMLFLVDPITHLPVEVDYAERHPAEEGRLSPNFARDAAAFFDSLKFSGHGIAMRPVAEVTAAIVQTDSKLQGGKDREDYPATVVFSLDPTVQESTLQDLAQRVLRLKKTNPRDPAEKVIAKYLAEETYYFLMFFRVPESIAGSNRVYLGDTMIRRRLLPKGHLGKGGGYGDFLLRLRAYPSATEVGYELGHVGIQWLKPGGQ